MLYVCVYLYTSILFCMYKRITMLGSLCTLPPVSWQLQRQEGKMCGNLSIHGKCVNYSMFLELTCVVRVKCVFRHQERKERVILSRKRARCVEHCSFMGYV
jgi:hypothetical protein